VAAKNRDRLQFSTVQFRFGKIATFIQRDKIETSLLYRKDT